VVAYDGSQIIIRSTEQHFHRKTQERKNKLHHTKNKLHRQQDDGYQNVLCAHTHTHTHIHSEKLNRTKNTTSDPP
jgi:hypothetical protein